MATTVMIVTDKQIPPKGSSRRNQMVAEIQAIILARLSDSSATVNIERK